MSRLRIQTNSHTIQRHCERQRILLEDNPDGREVYSQAAMYDHVAKAGKFTPWNLWFESHARQALS